MNHISKHQPRSAESALGHGRITAQVHVAQRRELPCEQQKELRDLEMKPPVLCYFLLRSPRGN